MIDPKKVTFMYRCPKGHGPTFSFEPEQLISDLDNNTLEFFCGMCGESYLPKEEEKRNLRKRTQEVLDS